MVSFFEGFKENIKGQKRNVRKNLKEIFSSRKNTLISRFFSSKVPFA
jgi:hypothetical protein